LQTTKIASNGYCASPGWQQARLLMQQAAVKGCISSLNVILFQSEAPA